jgi:large subunit ribosomal protein L19e
MGVGESKVWFDPAKIGTIMESLTRDDVRKLIADGTIKKTPLRSVSRFRAREKQKAKRVGRRRGHGSRKGTKNARNDSKSLWMARVRSQRGLLLSLVKGGKLQKEQARPIYMKIKGNSFKGKKNLLNYMVENKLVEPGALASQGKKKEKQAEKK